MPSIDLFTGDGFGHPFGGAVVGSRVRGGGVHARYQVRVSGGACCRIGSQHEKLCYPRRNPLTSIVLKHQSECCLHTPLVAELNAKCALEIHPCRSREHDTIWPCCYGKAGARSAPAPSHVQGVVATPPPS